MTSAKLFGLHPMAWVHAQEIIDQEMRMLKEGHGAKKRIRFLRDETNQVVRLSDVTLLDAFQSLIEDFNRDELIHNIDECCWMKDAWPVKAHGIGGLADPGQHAAQKITPQLVSLRFAPRRALFLAPRHRPPRHRG